MNKLIFTAVKLNNNSISYIYTFKAILYILLSFALTSCTHLLYPSDSHVYFDKGQFLYPPHDILIPIENSDTKKTEVIHGWYFKSRKTTKGIIVHFHGNGQNLTAHFMFLGWITEYGYDYFIFDYRGYGSSSKIKTNPYSTVQDGIHVLEYIRDTHPELPIFAIGQSLGTNVLIRTLYELRDNPEKLPMKVVLDSSFSSYQEATDSVLSQKWYLYPIRPFSYILIDDTWSGHQFVEKVPSIPALFYHGTNDQMIQLKLGQDLYEKWPGDKKFILLENGGHTSAWSSQFFNYGRQTLLDFLQNIEKKK